ncbi:hypothetical protein BT96DRAFT_970508 [Gymnopus androsaceus JB14]|uniref:N-acetyltransferase domain-containing protein n=1 Tax=Gymnopus androsaceus JB14 TaxID=1447944 RepID=A0A6A4IHP5_9AGAR|nr:hypothetical protein BT96DRAFT_970508 [Gymnopus androsaceus JB14]
MSDFIVRPLVSADVDNIKKLHPHIQLLTLGVLPEYQHQGLAKRLVGQVITSLHKDPSVPVPPVYTHVCTSNSPARAFYEQLGMKPFSPAWDPAGAPYVAKNIYPGYAALQSTVESKKLFGSRDAYILVGRVTA